MKRWLAAVLLALALPAGAQGLKPFTPESPAQIAASRAGKPFVLTFWSLTCAHCQQELADFGRRQTANLVLVPGGSFPKQVVPVEIGAGQTLALDDVVGTLFGLDDAVGALRIETAMTSLFTVSRTYATSDAGSYGQAVPAVSWDSAAGGNNGTVRTLLHLASSAAFRSNVGFVEVLGLDAELDLEMNDPTGAVLGRRTLILPASSHLQVNDIFAFLGAPDTDCASLRVEILNQARVFTYASVVDNRSSDPLFVPGMNPEPGPLWALDAGRTLLVPAAAATGGLHGTRWLTDLRVQELEAAPAVDVTFIPADGSAPRAGSFDFAGSGPLAVDDVVTRLGGVGNGHLLLTSAGGRIVATSRTYTAGSDGTYGQFVGALPFGSLEHGVVLGLEGSLDFRSNLGIVNDQESPTAVELRLVSAAGEVLGRRTITVPPQRRRQITDVFGFFGVPGGEACWLEFRTVQGPGPERRLYVHGSVVDNRSGDPSTMPAVMCFAQCGPPWTATSR